MIGTTGTGSNAQGQQPNVNNQGQSGNTQPGSTVGALNDDPNNNNRFNDDNNDGIDDNNDGPDDDGNPNNGVPNAASSNKLSMAGGAAVALVFGAVALL